MKRFNLLVIDPQNDFLDVSGAALPVPGSNADMQRLATWLDRHADAVDSITVTLDTHASVGVERTTFWTDARGVGVAPFTPIAADDVRSGKYLPRFSALRQEVEAYLMALEAGGQRQLVVWPVHCVLGTLGHNIHSGLSEAIANWEFQTGKIASKILKGQNTLTEQYSAFRAEVPRSDDSRTLLNRSLIHSFAVHTAPLLIAGEALSHCVAASVQDLMDELPRSRLSALVLLTDCMSAVPGFESMGEQFLERARAQGLATVPLDSIDVAAHIQCAP